MKETIFMRVLFCKIHCPFMCFCKPSAARLYTSGPLKLDSAPHVVPSTVYAVSSKSSSEGVKEEEEEEEEGVNRKHEDSHTVLKSCMRKLSPRPDSTREVKMKKVQWMDHLGNELAEIREFESSESGDTDNEEENSRCLCIIL